MRTSSTGVVTAPLRRLTKGQKIREYGSEKNWAIECIDYFVNSDNFEGYIYNSRVTKKDNYDVYNGEMNFEDYKYVYEPLSTAFQFPAKMQNFNLIKPIINVLAGEELNRNFDWNVFSTNEEAVNEKETMELDFVVEQEMNAMMQELAAAGIFDEQKVQERAEAISKEKRQWIEGGKKLQLERLGDEILSFLVEKTKFKYKCNEAFKDLLITDSQYYRVFDHAGEPDFRVVNPLNVYHSQPHNSPFISDCDYVIEERIMSVAEIMDEFYDDLEEEDYKELENNYSDTRNNTQSIMTNDSVDSNQYGGSLNGTFGFSTNGGDYTVYTVEWKTWKRINLLITTDPQDPEREFAEWTDEDYQVQEGEKLKKAWVMTVWEGTRIGDGVYVRVREKETQFRNIDNPASCKLGYIGVVSTKKNTIPKSVVSDVKPYQILYDIIWYRLELAIAQAGGKSVMFDLALFPKSRGLSLEHVIYYMKTQGFGFFDSSEMNEGFRSTFNQFQQVDFTLSQSISQYGEILQMLEATVERISGVSRQRMGSVETNETVGGVERSVAQSNYMTETLFYFHEECKKELLQTLMEQAKHCFKKGKTAQYVVGEVGLKVLKVLPEQLNFADFGVFVTSSSKLEQVRQKVDEYAKFAMQSGNVTLKDMIEIVNANSVSELQRKLKMAIEANEQRQQQMEQQKQQIEKEAIDYERQFKEHELVQTVAMNDLDNRTKLEIAQLQAQLEREGLTAEWKSEKKAKENDEYDKLTTDAQKKFKDIETKEKEDSAESGGDRQSFTGNKEGGSKSEGTKSKTTQKSSSKTK